MLKFFKQLYRYIRAILASRFRWLAILLLVWVYRVEFMLDTGVGFAKILQVGVLFGMLMWVSRWRGRAISFSFTRTNTGIRSLLWLYLFALFSTLWAIEAQFAFFLSFQNLVLVITLVAVASYIVTFYDMERFFVYTVSCIIIFENICIRLGEMPGLFVHLLPGASSAAMLFTYCIAEWINIGMAQKERKQMLRNAMILSLLVLLFSTSGGANASAVFGLGVALFFSKHRIWAILLLGIGAILFLNQDLIDDILLFLMPGKTKEIIEVGNGRDTIWEYIFDLHAQRPWCGWGYACVERVNRLDVIQGQSLSDAHNSYIGILGSLGYIGCGFLAIHILCHVTNVFRRIGRIGYKGLLAATCCGLMNSYSYGFLSGKACSITVTYFMLVVLSFYYSKAKAQ